mgnify:CR=1 FL=1
MRITRLVLCHTPPLGVQDRECPFSFEQDGTDKFLLSFNATVFRPRYWDEPGPCQITLSYLGNKGNHYWRYTNDLFGARQSEGDFWHENYGGFGREVLFRQ